MVPAKTKVVEVEFGVATVVIAFALAAVAYVAKLHDRVSDLFGIRARFDVNEILKPSALATGTPLSPSQIQKLRAKRLDLMGPVFYKFASSGKPIIDPHYITMALTQWSWYWVVIELNVVVGLVAIALLFASQFVWLSAALAWLVLSFLLLQPSEPTVPSTHFSRSNRLSPTRSALRRYPGFSVHYSVKGHIIKSENAAKPSMQASAYLCRWLSAQDPVRSAVDYGCGKLRYSGMLAAICRSLTLVDSSIQLDRSLLFDGTRTTVRAKAAATWPGCRVLSIEEFTISARRYDFILCANVLSAIPAAKARAIVLANTRSHLTLSGQALFVSQYRNSYFKEVIASGRAKVIDGGWLLHSARGWFYYGLLGPADLKRLIVRAGLVVKDCWSHDGSAYALCSGA